MLRNCKNPKCNQEFNAVGNQVFHSDKCRKAYAYMKKTGKLDAIKPVEPKPESKPTAGEPGAELMGRVVKVMTTPQGMNLAHIEFGLEESQSIARFWNKPAKVIFYDEIEEEKEEPDPTDDLFS